MNNEFTTHPDWEKHQRLEANNRLDSASLDLFYNASEDALDIKLQKTWATRLLLNKRGLLSYVEKHCSLYEGVVCIPDLVATLRAVTLDNACAGMRRAQWRSKDQRLKFAETLARLQRTDAFRKAIDQLKQKEKPLSVVLKETLSVRCNFLRMLIARDLAVLVPSLVSQIDVDECTVTGGGAAAQLVKCTAGCANYESSACIATFGSRLQKLHMQLQQTIDPTLLELINPQGWTIDLTENALCELRRWDQSRCHRIRQADPCLVEARRQQRLLELASVWKMLGFTEPPELIRQATEHPSLESIV